MTRAAETAIDPRFIHRERQPGLDLLRALAIIIVVIYHAALLGGTAFSHAWSLAVEDQFYLCLPFILLFVNRWPRAAIIIPFVIVIGGIALRTFLAYQNFGEDGVNFRSFQAWIYYPTWTRL